MDYSELLENYFYALGGNSAVATKYDDFTYTVEITYGDEEIETYLGSGFKIILKITDFAVDEAENAVFVPSLVRYIIPGINVGSRSGNTNALSNPYMACSLLEEVSRVAAKFFHRVNLDRENWVSLD